MKHFGLAVESARGILWGCLVALAGIAVIVGCSDDITRGGGDGEQVVSFKVTEVECPYAFNTQWIDDNVKAECQFVSEEDGTTYNASFSSPDLTVTSMKPGEYRVIVRSGRAYAAQEMPGLLVVTDSGSTYVQGQRPPSEVPSMRMFEGELELMTAAASYYDDTVMVYFIYDTPADSLGVQAEVEAIKRLDRATGWHMDVRGLTREVRLYEWIDQLFVMYLIPTDEEVYHFELLYRCYYYLESQDGMFPPGMGVDPGYTVCME